MSRPLRIELPGALYQVTSRGDRREDTFFDDTDRASLLDVMALGMARFDAQVLAYCLMGNHYPESVAFGPRRKFTEQFRAEYVHLTIKSLPSPLRRGGFRLFAH